MPTKSRIGDHAKVRRGASPRPIDDPKYFGGSVAWIRISDVTASKKYLRKTEQYLSPLGESLSVRVDKGDLIMSICGTIGRPVIVDTPACIHDGFVQLYDIHNDDKEYLYYLLQYHAEDLKQLGQPGTQVNLNTTIVENFQAYFPKNIEDQRKIAKVLANIDAVIWRTEAAIEKYKAIKQAMMQDLFTRGLDKNGKLRPMRAEAPSLYKHTELGWIPKSWDCTSITEILKSNDGSLKIGPFGSQLKKEYFCDTGYKVYGQENVYQNNFSIGDRRIPTVRYLLLKSCEIKPGDLLISMMGTIGKCAIAPDNLESGIMDSHLIRMQIEENIFRSRLMAILISESDIIKRQIRQLSVGSIMQGLSSKVIRKLKFPKPEIHEQDMITNHIQTASSALTVESIKLEKLANLRRAMMSDLLSGKAPVKA